MNIGTCQTNTLKDKISNEGSLLKAMELASLRIDTFLRIRNAGRLKRIRASRAPEAGALLSLSANFMAISVTLFSF